MIGFQVTCSDINMCSDMHDHACSSTCMTLITLHNFDVFKNKVAITGSKYDAVLDMMVLIKVTMRLLQV